MEGKAKGDGEAMSEKSPLRLACEGLERICQGTADEADSSSIAEQALFAAIGHADVSSIGDDAAPLLREIILDMARAIRARMNGSGRIARSEVIDWTTRAEVEFDIYAEPGSDL